MQGDSEIITELENFNVLVLDDIYSNIVNTIKNSTCKKEENFPVYDAYCPEFMTHTTNNSVSFKISKKSDEKIINEVHSEFLFNMFEDYKEANKSIINGLQDENFRLKSELRFARTLLLMIKNRLDEIMLSTNQNNEKISNTMVSDNFSRKRSSYRSRKNSNRERTIKNEQKFKLNQININHFDYDQTEDYIINQLNTLRSEIKSSNSKLKLKEKMIEHMKKTLKDSKKATFISSRVTENDTHILSTTVPRWIPDKIVKRCLTCQKGFGLFTRKHHCRLCGNIFCSKCCNKFTEFLPFYDGEVRACDECYSNKKKENNNLLN